MVKAKKGRDVTAEGKLNFGHLHRLFSRKVILKTVLIAPLVLSLLILVFLGSAIREFERIYRNKIYPGITIGGQPFGGKTKQQISDFFTAKSMVFKEAAVELSYEDKTATISANELEASYDGKLAAEQAYSLGRSGNFLSDLYQKWQAATYGTDLTIVFRFNTQVLQENLDYFASLVDRPAEDATFKFAKGVVTLFKPSKTGQALNRDKTGGMILAYFEDLGQGKSKPLLYRLDLTVENINPEITTENSNDFGVKELVGVGTSKFAHSIPGRVHNVELAASRISGHLIAPDEIFSFNDALDRKRLRKV